MTPEIALTFGILGVAVVLFMTELIRADLVALLVLVTLVAVGLVTPEEGISGFANPAVVTIWAVFILSAGLARTGVAAKLGEQVLRLAGKGESRLLAVLMASTAGLSAFMNNVGVAAMFLPVTVDIAHRTRRPPSRLLIPMAYGSLLGGMLVLIGTSTNLVVSEFLREAGLRPFGLFDFTPIGLAILTAAVGYMILLGRRLLPIRQTPQPLAAGNGVLPRGNHEMYGLEERLATVVIPEANPLIGKTLAESRFGLALGLNILSVRRREGVRRIPDPELSIEAGDRLLVLGKLDAIHELNTHPLLVVEDDQPAVSRLLSESIGLIELDVTPGSAFEGRTVVELDARRTMGINVLALQRGEITRRTNLQDIVFRPGDRVLIQGSFKRLRAFRDHPGFRRLGAAKARRYRIEERLLFVRIPFGSPLVGRSIQEARLAHAYGISVLSIVRGVEDRRMPAPDTVLQENDLLLIEGRPVDLEVLRGLQNLEIERETRVDLQELENGPLTIVEVMLSPSTTLAGKTLRQLRFRDRFGISVLAIWRGDRSYRTGLGDFPLRFGDAFLCYGPTEKFEFLARERDFVVLKLDVQQKPKVEKAPVSGLIMAGVVAAVLLDLLPVFIAAIAGAALMVTTRCLTMEEAYRGIEWRAVFLIAAMLPLGLAMKQTGAAAMLGHGVVAAVGAHGPTAILAGLMALTLLTNLFIPAAANAVVMTPIALATAAEVGVSPYPFVMAIAYAVASSFMTPVAHPVNVLVMSPGGYRFTDYLRNGAALSLIVFLVSIALLPVFFPF